MKKIKISADFSVFESMEELPGQVKDLMEEAFKARDKAYAPYSQFQVGAAILLDNGKVVAGSNQENAAYPTGLCAERTAIFYAGSTYPETKMLKMALSARSLNHLVESPTPPCGSCRQAIAEYEIRQGRPIEVYFMGETGKIVKSDSISDLLPLIFDKSFL